MKISKNSPKMTVKQYADYRGIERQTVYKHIRNGKLSKSVVIVDGKKKIIPDLADHELSKNLDQVYHPRPENDQSKKKQPSKPEMERAVKDAGFENNSLSEAQRLQANYKAALLEIDVRQKKGLLVERDKIKTESYEAARLVRDALMNIPDRISSELASCQDVHAVNQTLTSALTEALEGISEQLLSI